MCNISLNLFQNTFQPLATRIRPSTLKEYIVHLLAANKLLLQEIKNGHNLLNDFMGTARGRQNYFSRTHCSI